MKYPILLVRLCLVLSFANVNFLYGQGGCNPCDPACLDENLNQELRNCDCGQSTQNFSCGAPHNSVFYYFCPSSPSITFTVEVCNCTNPGGTVQGGIQLITYEMIDGDCGTLQEVDCEGNGQGVNGPGCVTQSYTMSGHSPGQPHILQIDGFAGDCCTYTAATSDISDIELPEPPILDPADDPVTLCLGEDLLMTILNTADCIFHDWRVASGTQFVSLDGNGAEATISGLSAGNSSICVTAENGCDSPEETCFNVEVIPPPSLNPIGEIVSCEQFVDFCDIYSGFFDPELSPDPFNEGWDISFHESFNDAENNQNPIACPYDLNGQTLHTIFIRVSNGNCYTVEIFTINFQLPVIKDIQLDPFCGSPINLANVVTVEDVNGLPYTRISFYEEENDAIDDVGELIPAEVEESGNYCVRAETAFGCFNVLCFDVEIVPIPEIEVEDPPLLCWTEPFEFNLDDLLVRELTGLYDPANLDIRWFESIPTTDTDLNFFINPRSTVNAPGCYFAVAVIEINAANQRYCASNPVEVCLDTISPPEVYITAIAPDCAEDMTEITFHFNQDGPFNVEYVLSNGNNDFFSTNEGDRTHTEEILIEPFTDTICVEIISLELVDAILDDCEAIIMDSVCIRPPQGDTLTIGVDTAICEGEDAALIFSYLGSSSLTVEYTDGNTVFMIDNLTDGHTELVSPSTTTTYTLVSAVNTSGCAIAVADSATITVNTVPNFTIEGYVCNGAQEYQATISISGGIPGTYTIDGNLVTNPNDTFVTAWFSNNVPFIHELNDASLCGPVEITGSENCNCPNRAGTMQSDLLELCVDAVAVATHNLDSLSFSDDNFYFALHTGSGNVLENVIATSDLPEFAFVSPMTTGTTYYISAVSGNDDGLGGIVLMDSCTEVSLGQPVIFYDIPAAFLDGESTICFGDQATIPITFTGEIPFRVRIDTNGVLFDTISVNSTTYDLIISPSANPTAVTIPWMIDDIACEGSGLDQHIIYLSPTPQAAYTTECDDSDLSYTITFNFSSGTGNYLLNNAPVTNPYTTPPIPSGDQNTWLVDDDMGCGPIPYTIIRDCECETDPGQIEDMNLSLCVDETTDLTQILPQVLDTNDVGGYLLFADRLDPFNSSMAYFQNTTISFGMMATPLMVVGVTYYIAPVAGADDQNGFIDFMNDDCAQIGNIVELVWNPLPDVNFYGAEDICLAELLNLNVDLLVGTAPFDITYTINSATPQNARLNSINDVLSIQGGSTDFPIGTYTIDLVSVTDANGCTSPLTLMQSFEVQDTIDVSAEIAECDGTQENYRVSFTISGGSGDYSVTRVGGATVQTGSNYVSPWIPAAMTNYEFLIVDNIYDCDTDTISGEHDCDCPFAGIVNDIPLELCEDEIAMVSIPSNTGVQLFDLDTAEYILHTRNDGIRVGPPLQRSFDGSFSFDPLSMQFGVTYYISRMVGDIGIDGLIDLGDECSEEVSNGQPVTWYENPEAIISGADMLILNCINMSYTLLGNNSTPNGNIEYLWILEDNGQTTSPLNGENIVVTQPGTYILEVTTLNSSCVSRDTVTVIQDDEVPIAIAADPDTLDCFEPTQFLDATGSDFGPDFELTWTLPDGTSVPADSLLFLVDEAGMYTLRVYNMINVCEQTYSVTVEEDFEFPEVNPGLGGEFDCHTDSILLAGNAITASGEYDINWYWNGDLIPGANSEGLTITEGGWYALEAIDPANGCLSIDSVYVSADEDVPYDAIIQAFDPQCHDEENGFINVDTVLGGNLPYEFSVNGGPFTLTPTFFDLGWGEYSLTVRDQNGCTWETTVSLNNPPPVVVDLGQDTTILWGDTIDLIGNINNVDQTGEGQYDIDTIYISYLDSLSCLDCLYPTAEVGPLASTIYTITVVTGNGCVASDNRRVNVQLRRPFFVPGAFSPNGDGINDFLTLHMGNLEFIERVSDFRLYDRWGEEIYVNDEIRPETQVELWDGSFNGETMNPQVFVWTATVLYKDGHEEVHYGDITLVR